MHRRSSQLIIGWLCSAASALSAVGAGDAYASALQSLRLARMRILAEAAGASLRFI